MKTKLNAPQRPGMAKNWIYRRGDIYLVDFDPVMGSEQGGIRPAITLSNDVGNYFSTILSVTPLTSRLKRTDLPTHLVIKRTGGLSEDSVACVEQTRPIDKIRIIRYLGKVSREQVEKIADAVSEHVRNRIPETIEAP